MRLHLGLGLFLLSAVGCDDGGSSDPLDCAWLASDNCWQGSLREVPACAPGDDVVGVLSADLTTCTYDDGTVINFNIPVSLDFEEDVGWDFEIVRDGASCLSFSSIDGDASSVITLSTASGQFRESASQSGIAIQCPSGESFQTSNALGLLMCEDAFSSLPGTQSSAGAFGGTNSVRLSLNGGADGAVPVFRCESAAADGS